MPDDDTFPTFHQLLGIQDPGYRDSLALSRVITDILDDHPEHPIVHIGALACVLAGYLRSAPSKQQLLAEHLFNDIRDMMQQPARPDA